jgi:hypothetical protein
MQNRLVGNRGATYILIVIKDVSMNILNSQEVHMYNTLCTCISLKISAPLPLITNEPNFGRIHLAGQYL